MLTEYFVGIDLGQRRDRTAIAILERSETISAQPDPVTWARARTTQHRVRHLERMPLNTPYTAVASQVARLADTLAKQGSCTLVVDATGVGLPVVDALRIPGVSWRLMPVTIGFAGAAAFSDGFWRVPKRDLIAGLQLGFDGPQFTIARKLRECQTLLEELASMRAGRSPAGNAQYGSAGAAHDDLALALALAWWGAQTARPGELGVAHRLL